MSLGYVVLAHRDPAQLARLGNALRDNPAAIHVDAGVSTAAAEQLYEAVPHALRIDRLRTGWASWNLVEATLAGLRMMLDDADVSHVAVLSGQDLLLRPASHVDSVFAGLLGQSASTATPIPAHWLGGDGGAARVRYWHQPVRGRRVRLPWPRRLPQGVVPHVGEQWCVLARPDIEWLLRVHRERTELVSFFRHVWIPDEIFIPTVIAMRDGYHPVRSHSLWKTRWDGGAHPHVWTDADRAELIAAATAPPTASHPHGQLFARKFDTGLSGRVWEAITQTT